MKFELSINIMPHAALLDPQGKAVHGGLQNLGLNQVEDVRVGKHITVVVDAADTAAAHAIGEKACKELLANPVMENFEIQVKELA